MVDWSKSIVESRCWSSAVASSGYAPRLSSNLAGRDVRHAILQPGTKWLAGDGAGWDEEGRFWPRRSDLIVSTDRRKQRHIVWNKRVRTWNADEANFVDR